MSEIREKDRSVFAIANESVGLDFTTDEQLRIAQLAEELKVIVDSAKKRLKEKSEARDFRKNHESEAELGAGSYEEAAAARWAAKKSK